MKSLHLLKMPLFNCETTSRRLLLTEAAHATINQPTLLTIGDNNLYDAMYVDFHRSNRQMATLFIHFLHDQDKQRNGGKKIIAFVTKAIKKPNP